jgi:hypothetical protein
MLSMCWNLHKTQQLKRITIPVFEKDIGVGVIITEE